MATFEKIAFTEVGSGGQASIDFTVIPSTFTDLCLVYSTRTTNAATFTDTDIKFNGSSSGYSERMLSANGTAAFSAATSGSKINWGASDGANATSSTFSSGSIYIPNYTGSTNKSFSQDVVTENNSGATNSVTMNVHVGLWSNTAVINQITLTPASGNFVQYSTATLYGIKKA
jgi:hypothetical protein